MVKEIFGRKYDSASGHGFLVGAYTRKIISGYIFSKNCKKCEYIHSKLYPGKDIEDTYEEEEKFLKEYLEKLDAQWVNKNNSKCDSNELRPESDKGKFTTICTVTASNGYTFNMNGYRL